jgi:hypothetical protein
LLALYPAAHRRDYGAPMAQLFRDQARQAYQERRRLGILQLWLRVLPDLAATAGREQAYELRRSVMESCERANLDPSAVPGLLSAAVVLALGLLAKVWIVESGGNILVATGILILANLAAAAIMEFSLRTGGAVLAAAGILVSGVLLPLLWVGDGAQWLRENPLNAGIILFITAYTLRRGAVRWPIFAVAILLAALQVGVSFL